MYSSYPQDRTNTQVCYRFLLAQVVCTSKCKQKMTSLSSLAGRTVGETQTTFAVNGG